MMGLVGMEKYQAVVCDNCVTIARGKYRIHQRDQTHVKRHNPSVFRARHCDFNLISPGGFRNDGLHPKLMRAESIETFFSNIVEILSPSNIDALCVVTFDAPLR